MGGQEDSEKSHALSVLFIQLSTRVYDFVAYVPVSLPAVRKKLRRQ